MDFFKQKTVFQIRRGKRDNLGIIFHFTAVNVCCDASCKRGRQDGSDEGSKHTFFFEK